MADLEQRLEAVLKKNKQHSPTTKFTADRSYSLVKFQVVKAILERLIQICM